MTLPYNLKPSFILQEISNLDDERIDLFVRCLRYGMENEWDCGLDYAVKNFGVKEWKLAIKNSVNIAETIEINKSWD